MSVGLRRHGCSARLVLVCALAWVGTDLARRDQGITSRARPLRVHRDHETGEVHLRQDRVTIAALIIAIQWPLHMDPGIQSILTTQVAIYVLLAMGLNVVVGFAGLLDLGYVAFWAIGAYTTAYFTGALPIQPPFILNPFWIIPFAIVAAMLTGVVLGTPTLRLRGDYLAIVTLGFGEIIEIVANNLSGVTGGPAGAPGIIPQFSFHLFSINYAWTGTVLPYYYLILGVAVIFMVAFSFLEHSRVGRSWTAIREDEVAADSVGINALKYKVMAFSIGASTSGFAGVFFASQVQSLFPNDFLVQTSILILVFVIFGGMGSIAGAVIGAFVIQWLPQYLQVRSFQDYQFQDEFIYLGALLILLMIFRPQGIIPSRRRRREILLTEEGIGHAETPGGPVRATSLRGGAALGLRQGCPSTSPATSARRRNDRNRAAGGLSAHGRRGVLRRARHPPFRRRHEPERRVAQLAPGRDPLGHRPERRRQDVVVQLSDWRLPPAGGHDPVHPRKWAPGERDRSQALQGQPPRRGADVPDLADVQRVDDLRERQDRGRVQAAHRADRCHAPLAPDPA